MVSNQDNHKVRPNNMAVRHLRGNVAEVESSQHLHLFKF